MGDRYYNNIFIKKEMGLLMSTTDIRAGYNVCYQGAGKLALEQNTIVETAFNAALTYTSDARGVTISFNADDAPRTIGCPLITRDFIGIYSTINQGIEDRDGNPITIDKDIFGVSRPSVGPTAGPFQSLASGLNTFRFAAGPGGWEATRVTTNMPRQRSWRPQGAIEQGIYTINGRFAGRMNLKSSLPESLKMPFGVCVTENGMRVLMGSSPLFRLPRR
jgi:hypothetical protein